MLWRRPRIFWTDPFQAKTYVNVLGDKLVDYWHSEQGVSLDGSSRVQSWTGQLRGLVLGQTVAAILRPTYGPDGSFFAGKSVVQCAPLSSPQSRCLAYSPGTDIFSVTDRPAVMHISRFRTIESALNTSVALSRNVSRVITDGFDQNQAHSTRVFGAGPVNASISAAQTTSPRLACAGLTSNELQYWENGQKIGKAYFIRNLFFAPTAFVVGAVFEDSTEAGATSVAMAFLLRSMPTDYEQLQVYYLAQTEWGI